MSQSKGLNFHPVTSIIRNEWPDTGKWWWRKKRLFQLTSSLCNIPRRQIIFLTHILYKDAILIKLVMKYWLKRGEICLAAAHVFYCTTKKFLIFSNNCLIQNWNFIKLQTNKKQWISYKKVHHVTLWYTAHARNIECSVRNVFSQIVGRNSRNGKVDENDPSPWQGKQRFFISDFGGGQKSISPLRWHAFFVRISRLIILAKEEYFETQIWWVTANLI